MTDMLVYIDDEIILPVSCAPAACGMGEISCRENGKVSVRKFCDLLEWNFLEECSVHIIFSESVEKDRKKEFLDGFAAQGIGVASYTTQASLEMAKCAGCGNASGRILLCENMLLLVSVGGHIHISALVSDGESWHWCGDFSRVKNVGAHLLKNVLVREVVKKGDENSGYLYNDEKMAAEMSAQFENSDEWLRLYNDESSHQMEFLYTPKINVASPVSLHFDKSIIRDSYERELAPIGHCVTDFLRGRKAVKKIIYVGSVFEEAGLRNKIEAAANCTEKCFFPSLGNLLAKFFEKEEMPSDSLEDFEENIAMQQSETEAVRRWVDAVNQIERVQADIEATGELLRRSAKEAENAVQSKIDWIDECLQKSDFDNADKAIEEIVPQFPDDNLRDLMSKADEFLQKIGNMEIGMRDMAEVQKPFRQLDEAKKRFLPQKNAVHKMVAERQTELADKQTEVDKYRGCYDEYCEKRKRFDRADKTEAYNLLEQMQHLTKEPLPVIRKVEAEITGSRRTERMGLFKKKHILNVEVKVKNNETFPCKMRLALSGRIMNKFDSSSCVSFEIEKGKSSFNASVDSTNENLDFTRAIYCYLFDAPELGEKVSVACPRFDV